jgi:glutathione S-transferase
MHSEARAVGGVMVMKLYDLAGARDEVRFSPPCWRIKMALAHKGLAVETIPWRFTEKDAIAVSRQGAVPVLIDGESVLHESHAIAVYLDKAYPDRPRLFEGPASAGLCRFLQLWVERSLAPAAMRIIILDLFAALHDKDRDYFRASREGRFGMPLEQIALPLEEGGKALQQVLAPLRTTLGEQDFLAGSEPGYADYVVFGTFQWARTVSPKRLLPEGDAVDSWFERLLDLHSGLARNAPRAYA